MRTGGASRFVMTPSLCNEAPVSGCKRWNTIWLAIRLNQIHSFMIMFSAFAGLLLLLLLLLGSGRPCAGCCFLPISPLVNFGSVDSNSPVWRAFPARLSWLLAILVDGLAPSAGVIRCLHEFTWLFATMSCVCWTHRSLHAFDVFLLFRL